MRVLPLSRTVQSLTSIYSWDYWIALLYYLKIICNMHNNRFHTKTSFVKFLSYLLSYLAQINLCTPIDLSNYPCRCIWVIFCRGLMSKSLHDKQYTSSLGHFSSTYADRFEFDEILKPQCSYLNQNNVALWQDTISWMWVMINHAYEKCHLQNCFCFYVDVAFNFRILFCGPVINIQ